MEAAPLKLQQVVILAIHTGQRYGDLIRLRWSDPGDAGLSLRQRETGAFNVAALESRDLCGTAVVMSPAAGLEAPQIASVTGHAIMSALDILERYGARNQAVARVAVMRLENAPETAFADRLQTKRAPRLEDS